jgi:predicted RNase H-like HicB family nuclease
MRAYPALLTPDPDGGFTVTFRDVPEAMTEGDTREEALLHAEDALESALAMYVAGNEPFTAARTRFTSRFVKSKSRSIPEKLFVS